MFFLISVRSAYGIRYYLLLPHAHQMHSVLANLWMRSDEENSYTLVLCLFGRSFAYLSPTRSAYALTATDSDDCVLPAEGVSSFTFFTYNFMFFPRRILVHFEYVVHADERQLKFPLISRIFQLPCGFVVCGLWHLGASVIYVL